MSIVAMNTQRGLRQLYDAFGVEEFSGEPLRTLMIKVSGAGPNPGWQASIHLSRLVRSGYVDLVRETAPAKAKWAHVYQLTGKALKHLSVEDPADDKSEEDDGGRFDRIMAHHDLILSRGRVKLSRTWLDDKERSVALMIALSSERVRVIVECLPEGEKWLSEKGSVEGFGER